MHQNDLEKNYFSPIGTCEAALANFKNKFQKKIVPMLGYFGLGSNNSDESPVISLSFNQTNTFFAVGTTRGYNIFCVKPFSEKTRYVFTNESLHNSEDPVPEKTSESTAAPIYKGLGVVEMLFRSNIFAIVGGGKDPAFGLLVF